MHKADIDEEVQDKEKIATNNLENLLQNKTNYITIMLARIRCGIKPRIPVSIHARVPPNSRSSSIPSETNHTTAQKATE